MYNTRAPDDFTSFVPISRVVYCCCSKFTRRNALFSLFLVVIFVVFKIMSCNTSPHCIRNFASSTSISILGDVIQIFFATRKSSLDAVQVHHMFKPLVVGLKLRCLWNLILWASVMLKDVVPIGPWNQGNVSIR